MLNVSIRESLALQVEQPTYLPSSSITSQAHTYEQTTKFFFIVYALELKYVRTHS